MYIKNPNKKVSYSFRINPDVLEDLKLYAKATNSTIPEVLNNLITDKLDGVTLTNDYLEYYKDQLITIPDLQTIYDNTNTVETLEVMDLLNPFLKGTVFKVKRIPNNLDVWDNTDNLINNHGFTSYNYPNTLHEGIEFVLAPEILDKDILKNETTEIGLILQNTILLPIWFKINGNNTLEIELITFREAIGKVKQTNNFTLMDKLSQFKVLTDNVINEVLNETPKENLYFTLQTELRKIRNVINTGNIFVNLTPEGAINKSDDGYIIKPQYVKLMEENQALKDRVNELETKFKKLDNVLDKLDKLNDDEILESYENKQ